MCDPISLGREWSGEQWDWPLQHKDGVVKVINTKEKFEVGLDCQFCTPKEIEVKVNGDVLMIHAHHQIRSDIDGEVTREVNRCYKLPVDIDLETLKSHLNHRGILTITAKKR